MRQKKKLSETKDLSIITKVQEKNERSFHQNTNPNPSKTRHTLYKKKLYTKASSNYLKLLNHKPKAS